MEAVIEISIEASNRGTGVIFCNHPLRHFTCAPGVVASTVMHLSKGVHSVPDTRDRCCLV